MTATAGGFAPQHRWDRTFFTAFLAIGEAFGRSEPFVAPFPPPVTCDPPPSATAVPAG